MENDNDISYQYDGAEFLKIIEDQRNSALTQAAQLTAVCTRLSEENRSLQAEIDRLRESVDVRNKEVKTDD